MSLHGQRVVVTRAAHQAAALASTLQDAGAEIALLPLLELTPPTDPAPLAEALDEVATFDWIVLTSANAVRTVLPRLDATARHAPSYAVVGNATARALHEYSVEASVEAKVSRGSGLLEDLAPLLDPESRVLLPQAEDAAADLAAGLRAHTSALHAVSAYAKRLPDTALETAKQLFEDRPIGWVTITSSRIARHFARLFGDAWSRRRDELKAASIGPVTTGELRRLGVTTIAEAASPSDAALVKAIQSQLESAG